MQSLSFQQSIGLEKMRAHNSTLVIGSQCSVLKCICGIFNPSTDMQFKFTLSIFKALLQIASMRSLILFSLLLSCYILR